MRSLAALELIPERRIELADGFGLDSGDVIHVANEVIERQGAADGFGRPVGAGQEQGKKSVGAARHRVQHIAATSPKPIHGGAGFGFGCGAVRLRRRKVGQNDLDSRCV